MSGADQSVSGGRPALGKLLSLLAAIAASATLLGAHAAAFAFAPDTSFGDRARWVSDCCHMWQLLVTPDGRIVVTGRDVNGLAKILRLTSSGEADPTFGGEGQIATRFFERGTGARAYATAVQPDGKLVVAAEATAPDYPGPEAVVARFLPDGKPDPTFGVAGVVVLVPPPGYSYSDRGIAAGVTVRPDGKIVAIGRGRGVPLMARLNSDGSLDSGFGAGGFVFGKRGRRDDIYTREYVAALPNGKLLVVGEVTFSRIDRRSREYPVVMRYNADGRVDRTFARAWRSSLRGLYKREITIARIALQPDGKIIGSGDRSANRVAAFRLTKSGRFDRTFSRDGIAYGSKTPRDYDDYVSTSVVADRRGRVYVGGMFEEIAFNENDDEPWVESSIAVFTRFLADGSVDRGFGKHGDFRDPRLSNTVIADMAIQGGRSLIVLGSEDDYDVYGTTVMRYRLDR